MPAGIGYPLRPKFGLNPDSLQQFNQGPPAASYYGMGGATSPGLQAVQATVGRMRGAVQQRQAGLQQMMGMSPAASAQRLGYNPQYGLGGVGGQYVGNPESRMGIGGIPFDPTRSAGQIGNMLRDPRQMGGGSAPMVRTPREGFSEVLGGTPGGISDSVAADRQGMMAQRRWEDRNLSAGPGMLPSFADRRMAVIGNAMIDREARRARMGRFTVDERMQMGIPGLAVERERMGGMRDIAGINADAMLGAEGLRAGAQRDIAGINTASNEKIAGIDAEVRKADIAMREAAANGDREAYAAAEKRKADAMDRASEAGVQVAGINAGPAKTTADAAARSAAAQEARNYLDAANSLSNQAADAYSAGDYETSERLGAQAQAMSQMGLQMMPQGTQAAPQPGLVPPPGPNNTKKSGGIGPRTWDSLPRPERQRYSAMGPEQMVSALRTDLPELSQAEVDAMVRAAFPGTTVSQYNPNGFGLSDAFGGFTAYENLNRFGRLGSPGAPQAPRIPGTNIPIPVVPGFAGLAQTYLGF